MNAPADRTDSPLRYAWDRWRAIETAASWFVLMNFLDAALTFLLLWRGGANGTEIVESNRIAAYFLHGWGFKGLFLFKLVLVLFVCAIGLVIATRREETARLVFHLGTFAATAVVVYSVWLYAR